MTEQEQRLADDKMRIEIHKIAAEVQKMRLENDKIIQETRKIVREHNWYPIVITLGAVTAGAAVAKIFFS